MSERSRFRLATPVAAVVFAVSAALAAGGCGERPAEPAAAAGSPAAGGEAEAASAVAAATGASPRPRVLLTGELRAARSYDVVVPRSPTWLLQVRWMAEDGTRVRAGEKVLELENEQFASELEERRLAAVEKAEELARLRFEAELTRAEKEFAVRQKRAELAKAELDAAIPAELLPARDFQDHQLARERAAVELAKAEEELAAARRTVEADVEVARIELARARREIEVAERAVEALSVAAPADGILVHEVHPWEGRTMQVGDSVWVGMTVMRIPDLTSMRVEAGLPDVDDGEVTAGMEVRCTPDAHPDLVLAGRVAAVGPIARRTEGAGLRRHFPIEIALEESDPERLRPGMSVKVEVLGAPEPAELAIPRAALDPGDRAPGPAAVGREAAG